MCVTASMEMCPSPPKNSLTEGPQHWTSTVRVIGESGGSTHCWGQHLVAYQYNFQEKFWPVSSYCSPPTQTASPAPISSLLLEGPGTTPTLPGYTRVNREGVRNYSGEEDREEGIILK